tara:strand:+ start:13 stop:429 length:417 start_codon:yes stop_codon:yes gene_type:complete
MELSEEHNRRRDLIEAFNRHILEFIRDLQKVYPRDKDIQITKTAAHAASIMNPSIMIKSWKDTVVIPYLDEINKGELDFFLDKNYDDDLRYLNNDTKAKRIMKGINNLRDPIKRMTDINKEKSMKYVQNLTKLARLYE